MLAWFHRLRHRRVVVMRALVIGLAGGVAVVLQVRRTPANQKSADRAHDFDNRVPASSYEWIENDLDDVLFLPDAHGLSWCGPQRQAARRVAARMADDQYYLVRARSAEVAHEGWEEPRLGRIYELENRLKSHRGWLSRVNSYCRRRVETWATREVARLSKKIRCDPAYDPLCCKQIKSPS